MESGWKIFDECDYNFDHKYAALLYNVLTMASNLRRVRKAFEAPVAVEPKRFNRIDDPELSLEVAARRERNNLVAVRAGLPAVGSRLVNRYGLEFVVESHVHVPTANSAQSWRERRQSDADLFPSIIPLNLSEKLTSFVAAVDRCTTKTLLVLDTMPHLRRNAGVPDGHWLDTIGNGGANLLFIDAAQIHETHFAHEIGHLWVQYVDQAEDERVMEDVSDAGRLHQLSFVQSFVIDLRVNELLGQMGFDVSVIQEDQAASIASLGRAIEAGYRPTNPREGVFMALALAAQILEEPSSGTNALTLDDTLAKVARLEPDLADLATGFADAVRRHGYRSKDQICSSVDECLQLAFGYTGDGIDLERDLVVPPIPEPDFDKYPQWIEGASPQMKCEVGRIMAREDIPEGSRLSLTRSSQTNLVTFELPDGTIKGAWTLEHSEPLAMHADIDRVNEINRQNRERTMKHQTPDGLPNYPGQARRHYMAGTARFLTRVREAEWLGGEHPYAYALNNPVTYTDPSGLSPVPDVPPGAGAPIPMPLPTPTGPPRVTLGGFPEGCLACAQGIRSHWFPTAQHDCNACYSHCTACCVLSVLAGDKCAKDMQELQNNWSNPGPKYIRFRNLTCGYGSDIAKRIQDAHHAQKQCSSACLKKCPYKYPNPRTDCDYVITPGPNGTGTPWFAQEFPYLAACDPAIWKSCRDR